MLVTRIKEGETNFEEIKIALDEVFKGPLRIDARKGKQNRNAPKRRRMDRFPTVALIFLDTEKAFPGFVASFTVLGATAELINKKQKNKE